MANGTAPNVARTAIITLAGAVVVLLISFIYMHSLYTDQYEMNIASSVENGKILRNAQQRFQAKNHELKATLAEYKEYKTTAEANIAQLTTERNSARTQLASTQKSLAETASKLKTVESEKDELTIALDRMKKDIDNYNAQIASLKGKLQTETKDKEFLLTQVKDLEAKRDELQRKWNNLADLRLQVRTLVTAQNIRSREELAQKRGYFGAYQKSGLVNFKTYDEVKKQPVAGITTIEVHRDGQNPPPAPAPTPAPPQPPPPAPQPKTLQPGQQPSPRK